MDERLYVLVRGDLTPSQSAVQAGHAVAQYLLDHPGTSWTNGYLIYLRLDNEDHLHRWRNKLDRRGHRYSCFHEEDLAGQATSIATVDRKGGLFKGLPLL